MANFKDIFYIKQSKKEGGKPYWMKIGVAWINKDDSLSLQFDVVPPRMENIQVRDHEEKTEKFGE